MALRRKTYFSVTASLSPFLSSGPRSLYLSHRPAVANPPPAPVRRFPDCVMTRRGPRVGARCFPSSVSGQIALDLFSRSPQSSLSCIKLPPCSSWNTFCGSWVVCVISSSSAIAPSWRICRSAYKQWIHQFMFSPSLLYTHRRTHIHTQIHRHSPTHTRHSLHPYYNLARNIFSFSVNWNDNEDQGQRLFSNVLLQQNCYSKWHSKFKDKRLSCQI